MLIEMRLENYAVIDNLVVEFGQGLEPADRRDRSGEVDPGGRAGIAAGGQGFERCDSHGRGAGHGFRGV